MASPISPRPRTGEELWRRSRIKTVVSRRFTSSFSFSSSQNNDEEMGLDEEEEYLSCFEDIPDSEYNDEGQEEIGNENGHNDSGYYQVSSIRSNISKLLSKRSSSDNGISAHQNGSVNISLPTIDDGDGDHGQIVEQAQNIDFVDMAISRDTDNPDLGMSRVDPNYSSRQRQKIKQKVPKLKKFQPTVKFGYFDIIVGGVAIILFFVDIGTDIQLAASYFKQDMLMYGAVTTGLIVVPSLITCSLGFHWYVIDYKKEKTYLARLKKAKTKRRATPGYVWFLRFALTLLQVGPVIRIIEYLRCGHKSRCRKLSEYQRRRYYLFMLYEDVDSCLLRLFESFLESAPQLTWQLYISIVLKPSENTVGTTIRCIALLSSWGSMAISLVSYHKSLRNSHIDKAKMSMKSLPIYFIWRVSEVGGRVICIAMFASAFQLWVFGLLLFHWVFMSCWLMIQKTAFYKNKCLERAFNVICGYVMIFCFLNMREGVTRYRFLFFYVITYTESFVMLGLWFRFSPDLGAWFHTWGFIVVIGLFICHIIFQLLYYALFHPTGNIEMCMSCDPYIVHSSTFYDIHPSKRDVQTSTIIYDPPEVDMVLDDNGHDHGTGNHTERTVSQPKSTAV